jgi:hypothetical protein
LDQNNPDDVPFIQQQTFVKVKWFPIQEDFNQIRHLYASVIKEFFNQIMDDQLNRAAPVRVHPVSHRFQLPISFLLDEASAYHTQVG